MRNKKTTWGRAHLFSALFLVIALPTLTLAQHAAKSHENGKGPDADEHVGVAGQQVAKDPATGKLRQPTREEVKALTENLVPVLSQSMEKLRYVYGDGGVVLIDLSDAGFENAALAKINPDGTVSQRCVSSTREAQEFLTQDSSKSKKKTANPVSETPTLEEK